MSFEIFSIEGNRQWLDGGAMFGNVPRPMWETWEKPDEFNRIELACRAFFIHDTEKDRRILLEAGIGVSFEPKLRDRYGVEVPEGVSADQTHLLLVNLKKLGINPDQIDIVILSHLHFDHVGGLLTPWEKNNQPQLVFPNAQFIVGKKAWERALSPHFRDRASFLSHLNLLLEKSQRLVCVDGSQGSEIIGPNFSFEIFDGHTPGMLLTWLKTEKGSAVFCGDLIPGTSWVHLPVTMGYDRFAEAVIDEKQHFLERCLAEKTQLLLTHDPRYASCQVSKDEKGRFFAKEPLSFLDRFIL